MLWRSSKIDLSHIALDAVVVDDVFHGDSHCRTLSSPVEPRVVQLSAVRNFCPRCGPTLRQLHALYDDKAFRPPNKSQSLLRLHHLTHLTELHQDIQPIRVDSLDSSYRALKKLELWSDNDALRNDRLLASDLQLLVWRQQMQDQHDHQLELLTAWVNTPIAHQAVDQQLKDAATRPNTLLKLMLPIDPTLRILVLITGPLYTPVNGDPSERLGPLIKLMYGVDPSALVAPPLVAALLIDRGLTLDHEYLHVSDNSEIVENAMALIRSATADLSGALELSRAL